MKTRGHSQAIGRKINQSKQVEWQCWLLRSLGRQLRKLTARVALWNFSVNWFLVYFWSTSSLAGSDTSLFIFPWLGLTQTTNKWDFRDWLPITFQAVNKAMFGWFDYYSKKGCEKTNVSCEKTGKCRLENSDSVKKKKDPEKNKKITEFWDIFFN